MSTQVDPYMEIRKMFADGLATSDEVLRALIMRQVIYKEAYLLATGTKVVPERMFSTLDARWSFPGELVAEYPVPEGGVASKQEISFTDFTLTLVKGEVRFGLTDEAKIRQLGTFQLDFTRRRAAEALAAKKDAEILGVLYAGAAQTVAVGAGKYWSIMAGDPEYDIISAWDKVLANSNAHADELRNCALVVPASAMAPLLRLTLIGNIQQTLQDYLGKAYGLTIYPTRDATMVAGKYAIFLVPGEQTALHGVLDPTTPNAVFAETRREYGYDEWLIRQYFKTKIVPEKASMLTTNNRICTITSIIP